jgi:hypothetical protein
VTVDHGLVPGLAVQAAADPELAGGRGGGRGEEPEPGRGADRGRGVRDQPETAGRGLAEGSPDAAQAVGEVASTSRSPLM